MTKKIQIPLSEVVFFFLEKLVVKLAEPEYFQTYSGVRILVLFRLILLHATSER